MAKFRFDSVVVLKPYCDEHHPALTCLQEDDLVILAEVHEAGDALGELHHVLDGAGDVMGTQLPHGLCGLQTDTNVTCNTPAQSAHPVIGEQ